MILGGPGYSGIDKEGVPEPRDFTENDITWNTHHKLREHFSYPQEDEFIGDWLQWFYNLNSQQRVILRNTPLTLISPEEFPTRPHTTKENA